MNIEQEMLERAGNAMAKDIDTEVLMSAIGCVYGARYLTVHPTNGTRWDDMTEWMVKTFGPSAWNGVWTPDQRWYANNAKFWFRDEKDLTIFILRWS